MKKTRFFVIDENGLLLTHGKKYTDNRELAWTFNHVEAAAMVRAGNKVLAVNPATHDQSANFESLISQ